MIKKVGMLVIVFITALTINSQAQAFKKGGTYISLGVGGSNFLHVATGDGYGGLYGVSRVSSGITGQLNVQGEWGIHKYVGLGFTTGIGGRAESITTSHYGFGYAKEFNIPVGVVANFHFFQLIADKKNLALGNKLDVYAGLSLGSGIAIYPYDPVVTSALVFVGPHAGVRYYFTDKIAVNGEVGYGKSFVNAGVTFALGGK